MLYTLYITLASPMTNTNIGNIAIIIDKNVKKCIVNKQAMLANFVIDNINLDYNIDINCILYILQKGYLLNRNYLNDDILEEEVNTMTKTLYDPEVEKRGIEIGRQEGIQEGIQLGIQQGISSTKIENAKNLLDILDDETIAIKIGLDLETVKRLRQENSN